MAQQALQQTEVVNSNSRQQLLCSGRCQYYGFPADFVRFSLRTLQRLLFELDGHVVLALVLQVQHLPQLGLDLVGVACDP